MANDRDCENCKHHKEVCKDGIFYHSCESWDCEFEPKEGEPFEPCEDCVSKQAVAEILFKYVRPGDDVGKAFVEFLVSQINDLPPVTSQPKTDWIPVSEDLPKDAYGCIVTVLDVDLRTQNEFENVLPYFVGYDGETWNNAGGEPIPYEVIAWMKALEPYKAEGSGEE